MYIVRIFLIFALILNNLRNPRKWPYFPISAIWPNLDGLDRIPQLNKFILNPVPTVSPFQSAPCIG
ncbi:hypothetical protein J3R74_001214 [Puniceicoccus vermicola]